MTLEQCRHIPKVELHQHLDGSLRIPTLVDLARDQGVSLPSADGPSLKKILVPGVSTLENYLKAFDLTVSVLQTRESLHRAALEVVEDWAQDGIVYGEVRFAPELHTRRGLSLAEVVQAVLHGLEQGKKQFGIPSTLILCAMRQTQESEKVASLLKIFPQTAFDFAGPEKGFPVTLHPLALGLVHDLGAFLTCHAGEADGLESIKKAVVDAGAQRIGHGTHLADDFVEGRVAGPGSLSRRIRERSVHLEVCLSSNLQTGATPALDRHPFPLFYRQGFSVSLCTDNPLMSDTTLSQELFLASQTFGLGEGDLTRLQVLAMKAAFCPFEIKDELLKNWPTM